MGAKISVIIPIYNCKKYLPEALDSLMAQTFSDFEVFMIDDSSTDGSSDIARSYQVLDPRFKLISNEKNIGAANTRNKGLKLAGAKYCIFLDGDDIFHPQMLEKTYLKAEEKNADIVLFEVNLLDDKTKKLKKDWTQEVDEDFVFNAKTYPKRMLNIVSAAPWNRLYRTEFLKSTNLEFLNAKTYNDITFVSLTMLLAERIVKISEPLINYRINIKNSITSRKNKTPDDLIFALGSIYNWATANIPHFEEIKHHIFDFEFTMYSYFLHTAKLSKKTRKSYIYFLYSIFSSTKYSGIKKEQYGSQQFEEFLKYQKFNQEISKISKIALFLEVLHSTINLINILYLNYFGLGINIRKIAPYLFDETRLVKNFISNCKKAKIYSKNKRVLIIEANLCHGEVMPAVVKYFSDLGFDIDVLVTHKQAHFNPFARLKLKNYKIFQAKFETMEKILALDEIQDYDCIFFTSCTLYRNIPAKKRFPNFEDLFKDCKRPKHGTFAIEHELHLLDSELAKTGTIFQLADFEVCEPNLKQINTHYFGDIKITKKNEKVTKFIAIGNMEVNRRNCNSLIKAVENLVSRGVTNFKITVIGRGDIFSIKEEIRKYFDILGYVDFETMYSEMEKADFFLPLLDPDNEKHNRYITQGTSGSFQLIYGFQKPCIMHKKFAIPMHGFDENNSLIYENNEDFPDNMLKAIEMSQEEYQLKQNKIKEFADKLYAKSIDNLKTTLKSKGVENV